MKEKMAFCEACRTAVNYDLKVETLKGTLKNEGYEYSGQVAYCPVCHDEVYVAEVEDYNLKALYDVYRQKHSLISLENILEIGPKYNIGKRPLSLLLNWGEMTFTRYCEGDMPTKQYSDILLKLYNDPKFYLSVLEENKANLKSLLTYEKSKKATMELLGQKPVSSKVDDVIDYLLFRCEDITPLALQKVLYYVQGFYFAFMGEYLFDDDCEAWVHGPVYRDIYSRYCGYRFDPINTIEEFDVSIFGDEERAIIDSVVQNLRCFSGKILESFIHAETPWLKTRGDLPSAVHSNRVIGKVLIAEYFTAVKTKYAMLAPNDIETYAKVMFNRIVR